MRVGAVTDDLMLFSRIDAAATAAGAFLVRASSPSALPAGLDLVLVDWSERGADWSQALSQHREAGARVVLYGRHTDLESHRAAKAAGMGPMWARSKLVADLGVLIPAAERT